MLVLKIEFTFLQPYLSREDQDRNFRIWGNIQTAPFIAWKTATSAIFFSLAAVPTDPLSTIHPPPFTIQSEGLRGSPRRECEVQEEEIASSPIHDDIVHRYTNIYFIVCLSDHL